MKIIVTLLTAVLLATTLWAQSPEKMSYQAVIRNSSDQLITNHAIGMQISILQGSADGTPVYVETQTPTSNVNGLVSVEIGGDLATVINGDVSIINWANGTYFIKTETDPTGGTNYTITGTSQLLSVPYALHAKTVDKITETQNLSDVVTLDNSANAQIKNVSDPTDAQDATTKAYVDALLARIEDLETVNVESLLILNGFTDSRDSNYYNVVKIGEQIWMAENLKYLPDTVHSNAGFETAGNGSQPGYGIYGYNGSVVAEAKAEANYSTYGVLYNWYAVNENICPTSWHVPTNAEWTELTDYLAADGHSGTEGTALKAISGWNNSGNGTDDYGFTALPGGYRDSDGIFYDIGDYGGWWSATESSATSAWYRDVDYSNSYLSRSNSSKKLGFSVRCVRD